MLSELLTIEGIVIPGDQLGRRLGFPTANLAFRDRAQREIAEEFESIVANQGLYFGQATILDRVGLNIHNSPTLIFIGPRLVLGETKVVWEAHIINEKSGAAKANSPLPEFYGATMSVALIRKLRDNMHFGSLEALKVQMQKDLEQAKGYSD